MTVDPLQRPARVARRIPGYSRVRRLLVPLVRGNDLLRSIAERLWLTPERRHDGSSSDITPGNLIDGLGARSLPVILIDARGLAGDDLVAVVDEIAELQLLTAGFRPVIVQSHADFGAVRRYGFPVEMMDETDHNQDRSQVPVPSPTWEALRAAYGTALMLELSQAELSDMHRSLLLSFATDS